MAVVLNLQVFYERYQSKEALLHLLFIAALNYHIKHHYCMQEMQLFLLMGQISMRYFIVSNKNLNSSTCFLHYWTKIMSIQSFFITKFLDGISKIRYDGHKNSLAGRSLAQYTLYSIATQQKAMILTFEVLNLALGRYVVHANALHVC